MDTITRKELLDKFPMSKALSWDRQLEIEDGSITIRVEPFSIYILNESTDDFLYPNPSVVGYQVSHKTFEGEAPKNTVYAVGNEAVIITPIIVCCKEHASVVEKYLEEIQL